MPKYTVECIRPVSDLLRAVVDVDAPNETEAKKKALAIAAEQDLYEFWQNDNDDDRPATARVIQE